MSKKPVLFMLRMAALIVIGVLLLQPFFLYIFKKDIAVLFPKGIIALQERDLLYILQVIMLLVVIPVYLFTFIFSWRYRAYREGASYDPELINNRAAEYLWWGIPLFFTLIMAIITWDKTHELDPYKPLKSDKKPLTVQAVALQWKWLFIYPEEKIASLNFLQIPVDRPIHFEITADAPMNSLWIPHLGGQIYAMPAMKTELNLIANEAGDFRGSSANLSGVGFSGMHFITRASSEETYNEWVLSAQKATQELSWDSYMQLKEPSSDNPPALYQLKDNDLFNHIIMRYMHP